MTPRLFGRSSSSFTRVTRLFAAELSVEYELVVVRDLLSLTAADYAGNPALKLPVLENPRGVWYGALSICRELARSATLAPRLVWPEELNTPLLANAQELTLHALATEVALIMSKLGGADANAAHQTKLASSLRNVLAWLDTNLMAVLAALPGERDLSYLEATLFCLVTHLEFREVLPLTDYPALSAFARRFAERPAARATPYRFDP